MKLRELGSSGVKVTPIAFGAWAIGGWMWGGAEDAAAIKAIRSSYEEGITTIDTAPVYGFGKSEELIGIALKDVDRTKYQILTKFGMNWQSSDGEFFFDTTDNAGNPVKIYKWAGREKIIKECEESLRRLRTDYIDLYQIHWPDATTPIHETYETLNDLIKQGKIRAGGVCNYSINQVEETLKTIPLASNQVPYSLINRGIEKDILPQAIEKGLSIIAYSPLQRGILTGKIKPGHKFNTGDTRQGNKFYTEESISKVQALLKKIEPLTEKYQASYAQVIINWTLQQKGIGTVLVGARDEQQVKDNVKAVAFMLESNELEYISEQANHIFEKVF